MPENEKVKAGRTDGELVSASCFLARRTRMIPLGRDNIKKKTMSICAFRAKTFVFGGKNPLRGY